MKVLAISVQALGFALTLLLAESVLGATQRPSSLDELAQQADLIVWGTVQDVREGPLTEEGPSTSIRLAVQRSWKGGPLSSLVLLQPQGTASGITQAVPGMPVFRQGEEVLLYLVRSHSGTYSVLSGKLGKVKIRRSGEQTRPVAETASGEQLKYDEVVSRLDAGGF